jgi:anti-anti-sigma factor
MSHDVEILIRHHGEVAIIHLKGDLTAVTGEAVENAYQQISADGVQKIIFFFEKECYINSGGIAILIGIVSESIEKDQTIRVAGLSEHFQKIFAMVGLTRYTTLFASEEAALEGF